MTWELAIVIAISNTILNFCCFSLGFWFRKYVPRGERIPLPRMNMNDSPEEKSKKIVKAARDYFRRKMGSGVATNGE